VGAPYLSPFTGKIQFLDSKAKGTAMENKSLYTAFLILNPSKSHESH
jgi:hypothetical protein